MDLRRLPDEIRSAAAITGREATIFLLCIPVAFGVAALAIGLAPNVRNIPDAPKPTGFFIIGALIGCAVGIVCAVVAARAGSVTGAVVAGGLGTVVSALTGYVGPTFMRAYLLASEQLRAYFSQAADSWRYLSAERLVQQIPAGVQRDEAVAALAIAVAAPQSVQPEPTGIGERV